MASRLKILISSGSKKEPRYTVLFSQKVTESKSLPGSLMGSLGREIHACRAFYIFLNTSLIVFLSESLVREPPPCSLTGSPWTGILCHQNHWSIHSFSRSFIHSFIHVCQSPQKGALLYMGKNLRSLSKKPHTNVTPTYNGVWPGSPWGSLMTLLSLPQCHAAFSTIPSALAWVVLSPISQAVS